MKHKKTALLLDDDELNRQMMKALLEEKQVKVTDYPNPNCVINLWEQMKQAGKHPDYDLILTDNQMPGMTGLEFLAKISEQNELIFPSRKTNKAVISGSWSEDELKQAQELGCHTFSKPTTIEQLFDWIEKQ